MQPALKPAPRSWELASKVVATNSCALLSPTLFSALELRHNHGLAFCKVGLASNQFQESKTLLHRQG